MSSKYIIVRVGAHNVGTIRDMLHRRAVQERMDLGTVVVEYGSEHEVLGRMYGKRFAREAGDPREAAARAALESTTKMLADALEATLEAYNNVPNVNHARAPLSNALRALKAGRRGL